jgi:type IV secretion system protein VirB2
MTGFLKMDGDNFDVWSITTCFMMVVLAVLFPDFAMAAAAGTGNLTATQADAQTGPLADTICNIVTALQGPVARGVAACGIIFLGFSLFMGKISWGTALSLGIGLGAIFGAKELVGLMNPNGSTAACA